MNSQFFKFDPFWSIKGTDYRYDVHLNVADCRSILRPYILRESGFLRSNVTKFDPFWSDLIQFNQKQSNNTKCNRQSQVCVFIYITWNKGRTSLTHALEGPHPHHGDPQERVLNWSGPYFTWYIWTHALEIADYVLRCCFVFEQIGLNLDQI